MESPVLNQAHVPQAPTKMMQQALVNIAILIVLAALDQHKMTAIVAQQVISSFRTLVISIVLMVVMLILITLNVLLVLNHVKIVSVKLNALLARMECIYTKNILNV
jgi:uncharacterized membrane protein